MSQIPRKIYIEQRTLEQFNAIDFFDFCKFSSDQKQEANYQWKTFVLPQVLQKDPSLHKRLITSWEESKNTRNQYWSRKKKQEKHIAQLDEHIDHLREDTFKQTEYVSKSITRDVGKRLQEQDWIVKESDVLDLFEEFKKSVETNRHSLSRDGIADITSRGDFASSLTDDIFSSIIDECAVLPFLPTS
ncbi:hypothetical protein FBU30_002025 [Linnemannia zychae]|nr:hypothetical protein FBU30_002025 [Linnemannia zychae]